MLQNPEINAKDSPGDIENNIIETNQKSNETNKKVNIIPIKLKLTQDILSLNKTNIDSATKRRDTFGEEISKLNKKHKVSFIDQVSSNKNLAQIIYINDQSSAQDCKIDEEKYKQILKKQGIDINSQKVNKNDDEDVYKIKRPKRAKSNVPRKVNKVKQQCECECIIY